MARVEVELLSSTGGGLVAECATVKLLRMMKLANRIAFTQRVNDNRKRQAIRLLLSVTGSP